MENTINYIAIIVSAGAALFSAICAFLSYLYSKKLSRRDMINELKVEILEIISCKKQGDIWRKAVKTSYDQHKYIRPEDLVNILDSKYKKKQWFRLILVALEELVQENNYNYLLGIEIVTTLKTKESVTEKIPLE